jgi:hypothetical protein
MLTPNMILLGVVVPAAVAGVTLLTAWRLGGTEASRGRWGGAVGLGSAYAAGHWGIFGWPPFPAIEATQWIVYVVLVAAALGLLESRIELTTAPRWTLRVALVSASLWLWLRPLVDYAWEPVQAVTRLVLLGLLALAFWAELELVSPRLARGSSWLVLLLVSIGSALALALSGSLALGQLAGVLCAGLGAGFVAALLPGGRRAEGLPVVAVALAGLWLVGHFYSELPATSALLLAAAPLAALALPQRTLTGRSAALIPALRVAAVLLPIAAAVALAHLASPE